MNCGIYLITNVVNNKVYVGSSRNLRKRKYHHWYTLGNGIHRNPHLQNAYNLYGKQAFHFEILEYCDLSLLEEREDWWIVFFDSRDTVKGYNLRNAESKAVSEETKAKISAANKGKVLSEETKMKVSANNGMRGKPANNRGISPSAETREKLSIAHKGRPKSKETKAKLSAATKSYWIRKKEQAPVEEKANSA